MIMIIDEDDEDDRSISVMMTTTMPWNHDIVGALLIRIIHTFLNIQILTQLNCVTLITDI